MKLPENIRVRLGDKTALAIYPNVYLPKKVFENIKSTKPDPKNVAILLHEQEHIKRQKKMGFIKWGIKYIFSPGFRFNEELIATRAQMAAYKKYNKNFEIEKAAKSLSSWIYCWPVSYKKAKEDLEKMWGEI